MRGRRVAILAGAAALGLSLLLAATVDADTGTVTAQYQGYFTTAGSQDPYASSNPQDVHVAGYGGQRVVNGDVLLNLDTLPAGSTVNGLTLSLTPNTSQSDNVNTSAATLEACVLTTAPTSNGYQSTPPSFDCTTQPHAAGELQANGDWHFELAALVSYWAKSGNTGLALVANDAPAVNQLPVAPTAWSLAFDHTKTTATVDYTPGSPASLGPPPGSSNGGGGSSSLPRVAPGPAFVAPAPAPLTTAVPSPSPGRVASPRSSTPSASAPATNGPHVTPQWIWVTVALGAAALLLLIVGASQQVLRTGRLSLGGVGTALARSRSQLATPVATLALASMLALGFSGQLVSGAGSTGGGGAGSTVGGSGVGDGGSGSSGASSAAPGAPTAAGATGAGGSGRTTSGTTGSGSASATNGNTSGGSNGPGVTATTVRVGFIYQTNSQAANQTFGIQVASTGNQQAEEQALVDYVNKHGGIGGRQIIPEYASFDVAKAETDPNLSTEICKSLTQDFHVFAVVGGGTPAGDNCYAQAGTMNFDDAYTAPDIAFLRSTSPYIWATEAASLDRGMSWELAGLTSRQFFAGVGPASVGVIVAQDDPNSRVYNQVTRPALQAAGISNPVEFPVPYDTESDLANTMKQAVVQFQAKGVTNVIFQGGGSAGGGSYAVLFMLNAESQHYNPRYGLGSSDAPVALAQNVPQDQLNGALAVGELGSTDTDETHYLPWPSTPNEKTCASIEAAAGNSFKTREGALAILANCNGVFELQQGAQGLTTLNAQLWANHAMQLGSGVFNDSVYRAVVAPQHWDAAGGYRLLHAVQNCETSSQGTAEACFVFDNNNVYGG